MMSSPTKRTLTDDQHAARLASEAQSGAVSVDVAASIRAASMRARKTVTEGYLSPPSSTLRSSCVTQTPALPDAASFPVSANKTISQILSSSKSSENCIPRPLNKRCRSDDAAEGEDASFADGQSGDQGGIVDMSDEMDVERPMKPLRRSVRSGTDRASRSVGHPSTAGSLERT
ncbi:hypothetical protein F5I97DRAFT_1862543 [Phlebopus sp. FC_14]|nr:hypothetical protein F5I97DRAFT_1862543 [Phlebopus sp. FC_14]